MNAKVDKLEIADEMLEPAIVEFLDHGRYFSSFNLAGVAEELYGKYVRVVGLRDSQHDNIEAASKVARMQGGPELTVKDWKKIATTHKNAVKHLDSESDRYVEIDAEDEARLMIADALSNHNKLNRLVTPTIQRYNGFGREWVQSNAHIREFIIKPSTTSWAGPPNRCVIFQPVMAAFSQF